MYENIIFSYDTSNTLIKQNFWLTTNKMFEPSLLLIFLFKDNTFLKMKYQVYFVDYVDIWLTGLAHD